MTADGKTLYASNPEAVYKWSYDPTTGNVTSSNSSVITGMSTTDHTTRTLLLSKKVNGTLLVSRGSTANIDPIALDITSGHSQVKAFNLLNQSHTYNYDTDGRILGWGLRNDVGVAEEPQTGGIYTVENGVDEMNRSGVDIHQNNPGEELNFLGYLNGTSYAQQGANFGYPNCFSVWNVTAIPDNANLSVGSPFAIGTLNATNNDALCARTAPPRLVFEAHMAPLDIKFNPAGDTAWITFHGSWDRVPPSGYKLSAVSFANGSPADPANSTTALVDIMANANSTNCPDACFRPVGLAWDAKGRLFMSSDATGEIWVVTQTNGTGAAGASPTGPSTPSSSTGGGQAGGQGAGTTSGAPAPTHTKSEAERAMAFGGWMVIGMASTIFLMCLV
ncbi:MAG: hypothetical protein M1821_007028 [Bathelium mastoideum]|nr:MAG: hypothetical protein M1821_007028 [Bathelium mastoideum]